MDTALQALLSYQFVLFCLAISTSTYVVTIVVNYAFAARGYVAKESHLWSDLILPLLPIILGSVGALLAKQYPYPVEITSASGRFAFGLVAGLLSGFAWRWIKAIIRGKILAIGGKRSFDSPEDGASAGIVDDTETK